MVRRRLLIPVLVAVLGVLSWNSLSQQLYRWVDDKGEVHYSDQVPPEYADKERARLSEQGIAVEIQAAPLTGEARERAQEQERRRIEDDKLLARYRTIEELDLVRDGRLAAIEATIQAKRDEMRSEARRLITLYEEMRLLQETDAPVPLALMGKIDTAMTNIRDGYTKIVDNEYRKQSVQDEFEALSERFRALKRLPPPAPYETSRRKVTGSTLVSCRDKAQCHTYWGRAVDYVRAHSDREGEVLGPGLLIAFQRDERETRTLTIAWTQKTPERPVQIYLDIQCKHNLTASLICSDPNVPSVREGFRAAVTGE